MNIRISKRIETKKKRTTQKCSVFELKIVHLSDKKYQYINRLFLEAKWEYNYILSSEDLFKYNYKQRNVFVKNQGIVEPRIIENLSSQMMQSIADSVKQNIINLSMKKEDRGKLKFKSFINRIPLKQYSVTYRFNDTFRYVQFQGNKSWLKVLGGHQITSDMEIANANLIRKANGFYLKVTTYKNKEVRILTGNAIGIDFGIADTLSMSDGNKESIKIPITYKTKSEHKLLSKKKKGSKNRWKQKQELRKSYEKTKNIKTDAKNKLVSRLVKKFDSICIQNENIKGWQSGFFGKQVGESCLGGIISDLKRKSHTLNMVDRFVPTTKMCYHCGSVNKENNLSDRIFVCDSCGFTEDRDIHSAKNILYLGLDLKIPMDCRELKPAETNTSTLLHLDKASIVNDSGSQRL